MRDKRFPPIYEAVLNAVSKRTGVAKRAMKGQSKLPINRQRGVTDARNMAWYLLHTFFQERQDTVSKTFAMHRGSVRKACEWVEELREEYAYDHMMMDLEDELEQLRDEHTKSKPAVPVVRTDRNESRRNRRALRLRRLRTSMAQ